MLSLWRRHLKTCPHRSKGRLFRKCGCPIWCDGEIDGKRIRQSLDTRDWARATRRLAKLEDPSYGLRQCEQPGCTELVQRGRCPRHTCTVSAAIASYHDRSDISDATKQSKKTTLAFFEDFLNGRRVVTVDQVSLENFSAFRSARGISPTTWTKELGILRHFFRFCLDNEWILKSWADRVPMPKNLKPAEREPYEPNDVAKILAACDAIGTGAYERLRARAMILLLRYSALRISDVATLAKNRVRNGEIFVRTTKNGKPVRLPVPPDLQAILDILPLPRGTDDPNCPYFFWSGKSRKLSVISAAKRTLGVVYAASGVAGACSHRFRHTLATEVLEQGGTYEEAADILGDTVATVIKHYAKWSAGRQARITDLLARIWHAKKPASQIIENESKKSVYTVGFEPEQVRQYIREQDAADGNGQF
jgi:site-specific recombinase XerD